MSGLIYKVMDDDHGVRIFAYRLRSGNQINLHKKLLIDVVEMIGGAAFATCTWKSNFHPMWPLCFGIMTIEGAAHFCKHFRQYYWLLYHIQKIKLKYDSLLTTGTIIYFANVVAFSEKLKQNNKKWITYLGLAAIGYFISSSANKQLGRIFDYEITYLHLNPIYKCFQLLFEPTLVASTAYYLLRVQNHEEKWLPILLLVFSNLITLRVSLDAYRKVHWTNQKKGCLLNGLDLLLSGCIICINFSVLMIYAINNQLHIIVFGVPLFLFTFGSKNIYMSLHWFQKYVQMEERVFYCICNMIRGPIIFFFSWLCYSYIKQPMVIPGFMVVAGIGLGLVLNAVLQLYHYVPEALFIRYCQRVLGPMATLYCTWVSTFICRRVGWRFSVPTLPLVAAGIYMTYRGWR